MLETWTGPALAACVALTAIAAALKPNRGLQIAAAVLAVIAAFARALEPGFGGSLAAALGAGASLAVLRGAGVFGARIAAIWLLVPITEPAALLRPSSSADAPAYLVVAALVVVSASVWSGLARMPAARRWPVLLVPMAWPIAHAVGWVGAALPIPLPDGAAVAYRGLAAPAAEVEPAIAMWTWRASWALGALAVGTHLARRSLWTRSLLAAVVVTSAVAAALTGLAAATAGSAGALAARLPGTGVGVRLLEVAPLSFAPAAFRAAAALVFLAGCERASVGESRHIDELWPRAVAFSLAALAAVSWFTASAPNAAAILADPLVGAIGVVAVGGVAARASTERDDRFSLAVQLLGAILLVGGGAAWRVASSLVP